MKVWNVSGWTIEARAAGENYDIPAFSEIDVYDLYHVNHLLTHYKTQGLVSLEYGPKMKEKYPEFKDYKKAQEISGLKALLATYETALRDEEQFMKDVVKKGGSEKDKSVSQVEMFENKIKHIKTWLKEAGYSVMEEKKLENEGMRRPDWKKEVDNDISGTNNSN
jgi:hypothetical protein